MSLLPQLGNSEFDIGGIQNMGLGNDNSSTISSSEIISSLPVSNKYVPNLKTIPSIINNVDENVTVRGRRTNGDTRIKLIPKNKFDVLGENTPNNPLSPLVKTNGMLFPYTPRIAITGSASYSTQSPTQSNQDYKIYQGTPSQTFTISCPLTARSLEEGIYSASILHFLRSVSKSRFGESSNAGLPPPVLYLNGYGHFIFNMLPVIVTNYSYDMPDNVDYIDITIAGITSKVPTLTNISVTVVVQDTPDKLNTFDIDKFSKGSLIKMGGWF